MYKQCDERWMANDLMKYELCQFPDVRLGLWNTPVSVFISLWNAWFCQNTSISRIHTGKLLVNNQQWYFLLKTSFFQWFSFCLCICMYTYLCISKHNKLLCFIFLIFTHIMLYYSWNSTFVLCFSIDVVLTLSICMDCICIDITYIDENGSRDLHCWPRVRIILFWGITWLIYDKFEI